MKTTSIYHRHLKRQTVFFIFMMLLISLIFTRKVAAQKTQQAERLQIPIESKGSK